MQHKATQIGYGFKVVVHASDMMWCKNLIKTHSQALLNTSCIVDLFNPIELHCGGE